MLGYYSVTLINCNLAKAMFCEPLRKPSFLENVRVHFFWFCCFLLRMLSKPKKVGPYGITHRLYLMEQAKEWGLEGWGVILLTKNLTGCFTNVWWMWYSFSLLGFLLYCATNKFDQVTCLLVKCQQRAYIHKTVPKLPKMTSNYRIVNTDTLLKGIFLGTREFTSPNHVKSGPKKTRSLKPFIISDFSLNNCFMFSTLQNRHREKKI